MSSRVAITGLGALSSLGAGAQASFERLLSGEIGLRASHDLGWREPINSPVAVIEELPKFRGWGERRPSPGWTRHEHLSLWVMEQALYDAGLRAENLKADGARVGLCWGNTTGGMREVEQGLAQLSEQSSSEVINRLLSFPISSIIYRAQSYFGGWERTRSVCSACSSGALAIQLGAAWIRLGLCERVVVGGSDTLCAMTWLGFGALGLLDPKGCRPFDAERAGLSLGEGAGCLVLEAEAAVRARNGRVRAWLGAAASGGEAHHMTQPEPRGSRAQQLIHQVLSELSAMPAEVDHINAHGTGTERNDDAELAAVRAVFGEPFPKLSSNKAQIGHGLGAAGALEAVFSALSLEASALPPNPASRGLDASLGFVGPQAERVPLKLALSHSFGFGGMGSVLAFCAANGSNEGEAPGALREAQRHLGEPKAPQPAPVYLRRAIFLVGASADATELRALRGRLLDVQRARRFDTLSSLLTIGVSGVLGHGEPEAQGELASFIRAQCGEGLSASAEAVPAFGLAHGTAIGLVGKAAEFLRRGWERGASRVPPAEFPQLLPSAAVGHAAIYAGIQGPTAAVSDGVASGHAAFHQALEWVQAGSVGSALACSTEPVDELANRAAEAWYGERSERWAIAAHWLSNEPSAILVDAAGETAGNLPEPPQLGALSGRLVGILGADDGSLALSWGLWGEPLRADLALSVEGVGGGALVRAGELLSRRAADACFVVDICQGRARYSLLRYVGGA